MGLSPRPIHTPPASRYSLSWLFLGKHAVLVHKMPYARVDAAVKSSLLSGHFLRATQHDVLLQCWKWLAHEYLILASLAGPAHVRLRHSAGSDYP